jgi:periplasmic protein TonB
MPEVQYQSLGMRLAGGGLVILLHVAVIYALVTGLAHRLVEVVRAPIETKIIDEARQQPPEPPPPAPSFAPPLPAFVPPPEVRIETPPPPKSTAITAVISQEPPAPPAPPVAAAAVRVLPHIDPRHCPKPEYPPASRRLGEQGPVILQALIDADGRVTDMKLGQSSGFERLDQAAIDGIKASCRFVPGTVDGQPAPMWFTFRFVWKLE